MTASAAEVHDRVAEHDNNPYVGPRAFRTGEPLYARDREANELADLLVAERIVLLHAPSGAGKTSLIRAALKPLLAERRFRPTVPLRVNTPPPRDAQVHNKYVYSVACGLLGDGREPSELAGLAFEHVIEQVEKRTDGGLLVLIFDQFEEILTLDPTDWDAQRMFFKEVGAVLAAGNIWTLFSMREDYMGGLDRYVRYLPGHLRATYRLDFLTRSAAKVAIQLPARDHGVEIADEAAAELVRRLALVKIQRPNRETAEIDAPYVQPVQLQVVCRKLWKSVAKAKGNGFGAIDLDDVCKYADIPRALRSYYAGTVDEVARQTEVEEMAIRDWFERELITAERFRSQTVKSPDCGSVDPGVVLAALESAYLIRSDVRANVPWYELTHDLLIEPILEDNLKFVRARLEPWQVAAREWEADRQVGRLLRGPELREATRRMGRPDVSDVERQFIEESQRADKEQGRLTRMRQMVSVVGFVALLEAAVILALVLRLLTDV
jgi:Novel STAND NTPase 1